MKKIMKVKDIKPNPNNPRVVVDAKFEKLKKSIEEFPEMMDARPLVVNQDGVVLGGNMRLKAIKALGWKEAPVMVASWDEEKNAEFIIKDNVSFGEWDFEVLSLDYDAADLQDWGLDISWESETTLEGLVDEDDVPDVTETPKTKIGDLYILGEHRLLCGDSTNSADVEIVMDRELADCMITDPPYNVAVVGRTKDKLTIQNDKMGDEEFRSFLTDFMSLAFSSLRAGAPFYVWHADSEGYNFRGAVLDCGQLVRQCLIWNKSSLVMCRQDYHWKHEPCLYGWKDGAPHPWFSDRKQTTVLNFDRPARSESHPTMKPVELIEYCMSNSTKANDIIYDPFLGSGTAIIAAEKLNRRCYGIELDPRYCDVIVKRWEEFTGRKAELHPSN